MILRCFILMLIVAFPNMRCSQQVTLTCGSSPDDSDDLARGFSGPPGKRGVQGPKGDAGDKGEKGQNDDNSKAIATLERRVVRMENEIAGLQRAQREERRKRRGNGIQISQLKEQSAQMEKQLTDLQSAFTRIQSNISMLNVVNIDEMQVHNPPSDSLIRDCRDLNATGISRNGVYNVTINGELVPVYCDVEEHGGGWTVFQKRMNRASNFNQNWSEYKHGFGNLNGDFWLGLDNIYYLTRSRNCKLRVDVWNSINHHRYAIYRSFRVEDQNSNYTLRVRGHSGTAGDGLIESSFLSTSHNNMQFTTKDRDNDKHRLNCASVNEGGWWFNACRESCLNCKVSSIVWNFLRKTSSTMKIRCD